MANLVLDGTLDLSGTLALVAVDGAVKYKTKEIAVDGAATASVHVLHAPVSTSPLSGCTSTSGPLTIGAGATEVTVGDPGKKVVANGTVKSPPGVDKGLRGGLSLVTKRKLTIDDTSVNLVGDTWEGVSKGTCGESSHMAVVETPPGSPRIDAEITDSGQGDL